MTAGLIEPASHRAQNLSRPAGKCLLSALSHLNLFPIGSFMYSLKQENVAFFGFGVGVGFWEFSLDRISLIAQDALDPTVQPASLNMQRSSSVARDLGLQVQGSMPARHTL